MTKSIAAILAVLGLASRGALPAAGEPPAPRPNICLILVDDYGIKDVGIEHSTFYERPNTIQTTQRLWSQYRDKVPQLPPPAERFRIDRTLPVRQVRDTPTDAGLIEEIDTAVGSVLKRLDELGLTDNTVVCFTSDNGSANSGISRNRNRHQPALEGTASLAQGNRRGDAAAQSGLPGSLGGPTGINRAGPQGAPGAATGRLPQAGSANDPTW